jgi:ribosome-interacting GTPase 1
MKAVHLIGRHVCVCTEIFHAQILFREDSTVDDFIDVVEGNRHYVPCLYVCCASPAPAADWLWLWC